MLSHRINSLLRKSTFNTYDLDLWSNRFSKYWRSAIFTFCFGFLIIENSNLLPYSNFLTPIGKISQMISYLIFAYSAHCVFKIIYIKFHKGKNLNEQA